MAEQTDRGGVRPGENSGDLWSMGYLAPYKERDPSVNMVALELNLRMAMTEASRRAALIHSMNAIGLSKALAQYTVLRNLYFVPERRLAQGEIGRIMRVTSSNVTRLIDGLEEDKLVTRNLDPTDRRVTLVQLTPKGEELTARLLPVVTRFANDIAECFSEAELAQFNEFLDRLQRQAEKIDLMMSREKAESIELDSRRKPEDRTAEG